MKQINIAVASQNPVKIKSALEAFKKVFPDQVIHIEGLTVSSGVADQPKTDKETLKGAITRAENAKKARIDSDYWVGIEGGIDEPYGQMEAFAWIYIIGKEQVGKARTASFDLPAKIQELIHQGIELGKADDIVFDRTNSKQSNGAVGILTKDLINRADYYEPTVILALIPFINPNLYP